MPSSPLDSLNSASGLESNQQSIKDSVHMCVCVQNVFLCAITVFNGPPSTGGMITLHLWPLHCSYTYDELRQEYLY